jgi:hypothetical protein
MRTPLRRGGGWAEISAFTAAGTKKDTLRRLGPGVVVSAQGADVDIGGEVQWPSIISLMLASGEYNVATYGDKHDITGSMRANMIEKKSSLRKSET